MQSPASHLVNCTLLHTCGDNQRVRSDNPRVMIIFVKNTVNSTKVVHLTAELRAIDESLGGENETL